MRQVLNLVVDSECDWALQRIQQLPKKDYFALTSVKMWIGEILVSPGVHLIPICDSTFDQMFPPNYVRSGAVQLTTFRNMPRRRLHDKFYVDFEENVP